jgi:hypothetical protein
VAFGVAGREARVEIIRNADGERENNAFAPERELPALKFRGDFKYICLAALAFVCAIVFEILSSNFRFRGYALKKLCGNLKIFLDFLFTLL